jgi:Domain of unknown function (DUF4440)
MMMKRCPTCQKTYTDQNLSYCIDDGTPLIPVAADEETTVVSRKESRSSPTDQADWNGAAYRPPGAYIPPQTRKRRVWPWVLGILALLVVAVVGLAIAAAVFAPSFMRRSANRNQNSIERPNRNSNVDPPPAANSNTANANTTVPANTNTDAPTDKEQVLAQLTNLEHEWTVANINADKKKLELILADDYVGPSAINGAMEGKRDYLRNIQRDTTTQKWDFQDLKVTLRGDRATLTGKVRLIRDSGEEVYEFTDKFVWRDGRWQATGSVVTRA